MTNQHPLFYDICEQLAYDTSAKLGDPEQYDFSTDDMDIMRAAADWQLEQVIEFILKEETVYYDTPTLLADYIKEAMRPQENS